MQSSFTFNTNKISLFRRHTFFFFSISPNSFSSQQLINIPRTSASLSSIRSFLHSTTPQYQIHTFFVTTTNYFKMSETVIEKKFPKENLVPKSETGVLTFLTKYPEFNGQDVNIAIFDTGVDPKAAGLQTTPDGKPKVIHRFDCSGCGDVDTTKKIKASSDGIIIGLSGRKLKLTDFMVTENINGNEYRVGQTNLISLYPTKIKERIIAEEKNNLWNEQHKIAVATAAREIETFDVASSGNANLSLMDKLKKENIENKLEFLNQIEKKYSDVEPLYDCVLYQTENHWTAVIDITESGDLNNAIHLSEYHKTFDLKSIQENLSVSINVHNNGDALELVGMCSSHGTHVASIASGNHEDPALNGIAPAAKIVSLTIGDCRLGSMETGAALIRAMIKVMELCESGTKIHVINMSYGEHSHFSSSGRLGEIMCEVVNKYGVVWVVSAGNHGPALCTIGTPPDIVQPILIGVGAYVSPEMIEAEYAFRQKLPANCFTWSSRDPCIDGGQGVTVCAPGAAVASVPEFTLAKQQLMNGTSMAAPHVAGAVALLISGLLKNGLKHSPYSIKRALWNTATRLDFVDKFAQGNGLLNVERAFEHLMQNQNHQDLMVRFSVNTGSNSKGIHIRSGNPLAKEYCVNIRPQFMNEKDIPAKEKINFNIRLTLVSSETWVQVAHFLDLSYSEGAFFTKVDPSALPHGVHSARILAYDSAAIQKGTLFEVPITVVIPNKLDIDKTNIFTYPLVTYKPATINRCFIYTPPKATWAILRLRSPNTQSNIPAKFFVHTLQILPKKYCKAMETQKLLLLSEENFASHAFRVEENNVLEICISKLWSNVGVADVETTLEFRGVHTANTHVMHNATGIYRFNVSTLTSEEILPNIQLKTAIMVLKPTELKLTPLSQRDVIPPGRQIYQQLLTYNLHLSKPQDVSFHAPYFSDYLYESEFESQLWQLFDSNKMMIGSGDAYSNGNFMKLEKGDYLIRLQVRHEKREWLEKLNESAMLATFKLANSVTLDCYGSYSNAVQNGKKIVSFTLLRDTLTPIYVTPLMSDKISKCGAPTGCHFLDGTLLCTKDENGRKVEGNHFRYILPETSLTKKNGVTKDITKVNKLDEFKEGLRDFKNQQISKQDLDISEQLYKEIIEEFPDYLTVHNSLISKLDTSTDIKSQLPFTYCHSLDKVTDITKTREILERIVKLSDLVINRSDISLLLSYYGLKSDSRSDAAKIKLNMDKQKSILVEAYIKKAIALCKLRVIETCNQTKTAESPIMATPTLSVPGVQPLNLPSDNTNVADGVSDDVDQIYMDVGKFSDYTDSKVIYLSLWHSYHKKHYGRMTKILQKIYEDKLQRDVLEELRLVVTEMQLHHVVKTLDRLIVTANPAEYRPF